MTNSMALLREYLELRHRGVSASQAVDILRARVEELPGADRVELVRQIREFEDQRSGAGTATPKPRGGATTFLNPEMAAALAQAQQAGAIKPLKQMRSPSDTNPGPVLGNGGGPAVLIACPNCGKRNREGELFCYSCGQVLKMDMSTFETVRFSDPNVPTGDYFPPNGSIMLVQRGSDIQYRVRPADLRHDIVIGRADNTVAPDIDLGTATGDKLSVSRVHLTIRHNRQTNTVAAIDMGSANGTFLNGQRLYPQEVRTLRHGDEVRIGNLVFNLYFVQ